MWLMQGTSGRHFQNCNAKETHWPKMGYWGCEVNIQNKKSHSSSDQLKCTAHMWQTQKDEICEK